MQFQKWSQAELAMEGHNGKTRLGNSEVPLVVKFADAKRKDAMAGQVLHSPQLLLSGQHHSPIFFIILARADAISTCARAVYLQYLCCGT